MGVTTFVRGRYQQAGDGALADVAKDTDVPSHAVEQAEERQLVDELAASLPDDRLRQVLQVKFLSGTRDPLGYKQIAQTLGISIAAARKADRDITRHINAFAALTAGKLCPKRKLSITSVVANTADAQQVALALSHVAHCPHCRDFYVAHARAFGSAAFQRKIAAALPAVESNDRRRLRGAWDAVTDWVTRPFGHDSVSTAAQMAASGAGRGIGTVATLKIAGACLASATAITVCTTALVVPALTDKPPVQTAPKRAKPEKREKPVGKHDRPDTRAEQHLAQRRPLPKPTPAPKRSGSISSSSSRQAKAAAERTRGRRSGITRTRKRRPRGRKRIQPDLQAQQPTAARPGPRRVRQQRVLLTPRGATRPC